MAEKISEIQQKILDYRENKGYSIDKTIEELKITRKRFNQNVEKLKEKGLYNEQKIKEAMKNRRLNKEIDQKNFSTKLNLNPEEEEYIDEDEEPVEEYSDEEEPVEEYNEEDEAL